MNMCLFAANVCIFESCLYYIYRRVKTTKILLGLELSVFIKLLWKLLLYNWFEGIYCTIPSWAFWNGAMTIEGTKCSGTQSWILERLNDHFGALPKRERSSLISMIMWTISEGSNYNLRLDCETMFSLCVCWCCFEVDACCQKRESLVIRASSNIQAWLELIWKPLVPVEERALLS